MTTPIINPSSLTEEQREAIKAEFINISELPNAMPPSIVKIISIMNFTMIKIFGKSMFEKGENNE